MKNKYGFTLVELLAVVVIVGILTTIAVPQYTKAVHRSEAANALISLKSLYNSAKRHYSTSDAWPDSFQGLDTKILLDVNSDGGAIAQDSAWYGTSGEFRYQFDSTQKTVSACRVSGSLAGDPTVWYCLTATYRPLTNRPDTYTCQYMFDKYENLCASMCKTAPDNSTCEL